MSVPDPRFRDQLAEQAWGVLACSLPVTDGGREISVIAHAIVGNLLPLIAAHMDAEVQAATNQRAAKILREAADWIWDEPPALASASAELHARADHLDALTQPAPTHTRTAEGEQPEERPPK